MTIIYKTAPSEIQEGRECILSDATPDRYGDIVSGRWDITNFSRNPIALLNHNSDFPIGRWENVRPEAGALRGKLHLAPKGTSDRIDEVRKLVDAKILRGISVGFMPIESEPRSDAESGRKYTKMELVECSLVSVPANPNATLLQVRAMGISPQIQAIVFKDMTGAERMKRARANARRRKVEAGQQGRSEAVAIYERSIAALDRALRELECGEPVTRRERAITATERARATLQRLAEQEAIEYTRHPWNQGKFEQEDADRRHAEWLRRNEADWIAAQKKRGIDPASPSDTWQGKKVPGQTWRGKKV